ncbi:MAG: SIS domain-containing protein [Armatimonadota bacterium]|nr:SIS domain-containing protein [Armatimonadota bacterium]
MSGPSTDSRTVADRVRRDLEETVAVIQACLDLSDQIAAAAGVMLDAVRDGAKLVFIGNGGSAADAQHLTADLVGRFRQERRPIPAVALTADTSVLTAVANDYGFAQVFARQVRALVRPGDVLVAISTSGASADVLAAVEAARHRGARLVALTGRHGGSLAEAADIAIRVPSDDVAHVQDAHLAVGHTICGILEDAWRSGDIVADQREAKEPWTNR